MSKKKKDKKPQPQPQQPQGNKDGVDLLADGTEPTEEKQPQPQQPQTEPDDNTIYYCPNCTYATRYPSQALYHESAPATPLCPRHNIELLTK